MDKNLPFMFMTKLYSLITFLILCTTTLSAQEMDWVNLQFPPSATLTLGNGVTVYTQGYEPGVTEAAGPGTGINVWIGLSTSNTNPSTWTSWMPATFNVNTGNNDEFMANIGANLAPGTYYYASRWQVNAGPFRYGGLSGFWVAGQSGVLTVNPGSQPANNECASAAFLSSIPVTYTNLGASQSRLPEACAAVTAASAQDVWFRFTPGSTGTLSITVDNLSGFIDPVLTAYSGTCASLVNIGCVNAAGANGNEVLVLNSLSAGQTYFLRVYGNTLFQGSFNIYVSGGALPVSIQYFKGSKQNNRNLLDWKVACYNSPTATMVLERSNDARKFEPINSITETATRCLQPFSFVDASPLAGVNYYRLKTIDADGKVSYSTIVALINKDKGFEITSLMPNPVKAAAILSVISAEKTILQVVVSDLAGRQLSKQQVILVAGGNQVPLKLGNLSAGSYQVTGITTDGIATTLRFVKE
jgi:hypothetical protein